MIGRPQIIDDINEALETSVPTIHVDWRKNSEDIVHYVESSIRKSKVLSRTPKSLQEEIVETLTKNAKGMFIWCDLMMRELSKKSRASAIRESLHHVPKGLTPMLRHVLESFSVTLKEEGPDDLNTMLAWVACAARPLTLGELDTILKLKSSEGDEVLYLEGKLRKQFASFFTLMREDGLSTADLQGDAKTQYVPEREDEDADEKEGLEDIENETDFTSNPGTTYVTFCHASIGEFLRDEKQGMVSAGEDNPAVGVNIIEAKTTVLKTCLKLICDPNLSSKMKGSPSLQPYATECWHKHLQAAAGDLTKISVSEKQDVGELLVKLLRDEDAITAWVGQQNYEFFTAETLKTLTLWLEDKEILDSPPAEDREWIQSALQSHAEIFVPAAKILANQWLQDTFWNPIGIMACIHFITSLLRGESVESLPDPMPLQTILDAAEWPQFEKNALWHRRLAMCLRDYQFYDEAMDHFESALKMDEKMWRARSGMALIHALRGKHEKQIEILKGYVPILQRELEEQKEASDFNPKNEGIWNLGDTYGEIAEAYGKLDDWANSLEYYRKAFEVESQDYSYLERIVYILGRKQEPKDYEGIIKLIKSMEDPIEGEDYTLLTECISTYKWFDEDFFQICAEAAKETNELAWLRNAYLAAISTARQELEPVLTITLEVCLGELLAKYGRDQVQAARLWERVIRVATVAGGTDNALINFCKDAVVKRFSTFCLQKALDAGKGSPEADKYIKKLERLCKQKAKATGDALELVTTNYSAVYLGLWYRLIKQEQEARAYFQPWIKETLMILSDDDPDNDDIGYYYLGHVLLAAGDEVNALAVLHALKPIRRKDVTTESKDESSKVKATEEKPSEDDAGSSRTHAKQEAEEEEKEKRLSGESNNESSSDKENLVIEEKPSSKEGNVITEEEKSSVTQDAQPPAEENRRDVPPNPATIDFDQLMRQVYPHATYSYPWCCDGVCDRSFPTFVNGNVCRYCLADLCEDCLSLVKDDALAVHMICNPHHEWLHVPLLPELSARLMTASGSAEERKRSIAPPTAGGEVFVAGRKVDLEDFNAGLRREWKV
jgi:tetratricopeptide (TPR) repeat protein